MVLSRVLSLNKLTKVIIKLIWIYAMSHFKDPLGSKKLNLLYVAFPCAFLNDLLLLLMNDFLLHDFSCHLCYHPSANKRNTQRFHMCLDVFPNLLSLCIFLHISLDFCKPLMNLYWFHTICIKCTILTSISVLISVCIRVVVWVDFKISNFIKNFVTICTSINLKPSASSFYVFLSPSYNNKTWTLVSNSR